MIHRLLQAMRRTLPAPLLASLCALLSSPAAAAPPKVPVQGVLTDVDGAPIEGALDVAFALYPDVASDAALWSETQTVDFERGVFAVYLGAEVPLDASVFDSNRAVWLAIAVDGDEEMQRVEIATAPYAAFAAYASDAETLGGAGPEAFAPTAHRHGWDAIDGIPPDLADGDDDTRYDAAPGGGIALMGAVFGLVPCAEGELLKYTAAGWACAADALGDVEAARITDATLQGTELTVTEGGRTLRVELASLIDDADADATNELLQEGMLDGTTLRLVDAGGEVMIDLAALASDADADPLNEVLQAAALNGTVLELSDAGGLTTVDLAALVADGDADPLNEALTEAMLDGATLVLTEGGRVLRVDLTPIASDADADPRNEVIDALRLDGTRLVVSEAGGEQSVDLAALGDDADPDPRNEVINGIRLDGTRLVVSEAGGEQSVDLAALGDDADPDPRNEVIDGIRLDGTRLVVSEAGGEQSVDLTALGDDADPDPRNELLTGAALAGTVLTLTDAGGARQVELASLVNDADADPRNELLQNASLLGTQLQITDAGGTRQVELASLVDDADADPRNELLTGVGLAGTVLTLTDAGGQRQVDLVSLGNDADADPRNELQTLAFDGNGNLSILGGNTVNIGSGYALAVHLGRSADDINFPVGINNVDDTTADVDLPFSVTYDGVVYSRVRISTNGWMEFGNSNSGADLGNRCLPATLHNGPFVAAYWDDLISTVRWATEGTASNRVFAVHFDSTTFTGGNNVDFTIEVHEGSGAINVRYLTNAPAAVGQSATVGFQAAGAQNAKAYAIGCNVAVIDDNADDADPNTQGWSITPVR